MMKGIVIIQLSNGRVRKAEIHWYEAHGVGQKEFKRKGHQHASAGVETPPS